MKREICKHYAQFGTCKFGDQCRYEHVGGGEPGAFHPRGPRPYGHRPRPRPDMGSQSFPDGASGQVGSFRPPWGAPDTSGPGPRMDKKQCCRYFQMGNCTNLGCRYRGPESRIDSNTASQRESTEEAVQ